MKNFCLFNQSGQILTQKDKKTYKVLNIPNNISLNTNTSFIFGEECKYQEFPVTYFVAICPDSCSRPDGSIDRYIDQFKVDWGKTSSDFSESFIVHYQMRIQGLQRYNQLYTVI